MQQRRGWRPQTTTATVATTATTATTTTSATSASAACGLARERLAQVPPMPHPSHPHTLSPAPPAAQAGHGQAPAQKAHGSAAATAGHLTGRYSGAAGGEQLETALEGGASATAPSARRALGDDMEPHTRDARHAGDDGDGGQRAVGAHREAGRGVEVGRHGEPDDVRCNMDAPDRSVGAMSMLVPDSSASNSQVPQAQEEAAGQAAGQGLRRGQRAAGDWKQFLGPVANGRDA